jgi:hypothetical protein
MRHTDHRNAPGPGDLYGSPPDDVYVELCERCGEEFEPTKRGAVRCDSCEDMVRWFLVESMDNGEPDREVGVYLSRDTMMCALTYLRGTFRFWAECDGQLLNGTESERVMS